MIQQYRYVFASFLVLFSLFSFSQFAKAQSPSPTVAIPTVTITSAATTLQTSATMYANITSIGGAVVTRRGFNYGLTSSYTNSISDISSSLPVGAYSKTLSNLVCGTTYHYRAFATNTGGTASTTDYTFTTAECASPSPTVTATPVAKPVLAVPTASSIGQTSATLNGNIISIGGASVTSRGFQYGLTTNYSTNLLTYGSYGTGAFSDDLTNLSCGTTYHFIAVASNSGGTATSSDQTFTTTACPTVSASPSPTPVPVVSTSNATSITDTSATLNGNITNTGGAGINVTRRGFQYGVGSYSDVICEDGTFSTGTYSRASHTTCGGTTAATLTCGTTYQYRAFAVNAGGTDYGVQSSFTTTVCPTPSSTPTPTTSQSTPTVTNLTIGSITPTSAILTANLLQTGNDDVTARGFNYGRNASFGSTTVQTSGPYSTGNYSATVSNLICNTTYYVQAFATNSIGTTYTATDTFDTSACPTPSATPTPSPSPTPPAVSLIATSSNVTRTTVTLTGSITAGSADERGFEYGLNPSYGTTKKETGSYGAGSFSLGLSGLSPGTTYHFRAYAKNAGGSNHSNDYSFTTNPSPGNLVGWAYSSNIGWVNLNSISIDQATGNLTGYAWSSNIGWIKFGGLSDFPGGGSPGANAKIDLDTGEVTGWIRACAGTVGGETAQYGADCRSMTSRTDGWDGWIELSGQNHISLASAIKSKFWSRWTASAQSSDRMEGLRMDVKTGIVSGMAWGGPVIGWLNFNAGTSSASLPFIATCSSLKLSSSKIRFTALPTGGSGSYEYAWNESAIFSSAYYYDKVYSGSGSLSVDLNVRESGQNNPINVTCTYNPPTDITIGGNPVCSASSPAILIGDKVTFFVNQPSPSATYNYVWLTGDNVNPSSATQRTYDYIYTTAGSYDIGVIVRNIATGQTATFNTCGNVKVSNKELKLFIGASPDDITNKPEASKKTYLTKAGDGFALQWTNTLDQFNAVTKPAGYQCSYLLSNSSDPAWANNWLNNNQLNGVLSSIANVVGTYKFEIACQSSTLNPITDSVILKVISSTVKEI